MHVKIKCKTCTIENFVLYGDNSQEFTQNFENSQRVISYVGYRDITVPDKMMKEKM